MFDAITTLATCIKISSLDGSTIAMTDYDQLLFVDHTTYYPNKCFSYSKISYSSSFDVDKISLEGVLSSDSILESDILAGKYDAAQIEVFCIDYTRPKDEKIILKLGSINRIRLVDGKFIAEVSSIKSKKQDLTETFSPLCRAQFCDDRCKLNASNFTHNGVVSEVLSGRKRFIDHSLQKEKKNYYKYGVVKFVSGKNKSVSIPVNESSDSLLELLFVAPHEIESGDTYTILAGCDKLFSTCYTKFNNTINFRGEPHIVGAEKKLQSIQGKV